MKAKIGDVLIGKDEALKVQDITTYGYCVMLYQFKDQKCLRDIHYHSFPLPRYIFTNFRLATKTETAKYTLLAGW